MLPLTQVAEFTLPTILCNHSQNLRVNHVLGEKPLDVPFLRQHDMGCGVHFPRAQKQRSHFSMSLLELKRKLTKRNRRENFRIRLF